MTVVRRSFNSVKGSLVWAPTLHLPLPGCLSSILAVFKRPNTKRLLICFGNKHSLNTVFFYNFGHNSLSTFEMTLWQSCPITFGSYGTNLFHPNLSSALTPRVFRPSPPLFFFFLAAAASNSSFSFSSSLRSFLSLPSQWRRQPCGCST